MTWTLTERIRLTNVAVGDEVKVAGGPYGTEGARRIARRGEWGTFFRATEVLRGSVLTLGGRPAYTGDRTEIVIGLENGLYAFGRANTAAWVRRGEAE